MAHHCHATGCATAVPPVMFLCKRHWFRLPKALRDRIWATYRAGQCDDMSPSPSYCEAAKAAVTYLAEKEGKAPDVALYDLILRRQPSDLILRRQPSAETT